MKKALLYFFWFVLVQFFLSWIVYAVWMFATGSTADDVLRAFGGGDAAAVTALPADLNAAIERMEEDPLVRSVLGSHIYEKYLAAKRTEWREYRMRVSQWELDEYLGKY